MGTNQERMNTIIILSITFRLEKKVVHSSHNYSDCVLSQVNLNDVFEYKIIIVMTVCPETASIKHHAEVSIYGPIHTYTYQHYINENDHIKEKSKDSKHKKVPK